MTLRSFLAALFLLGWSLLEAQPLTNLDRQRGHIMLRFTRDDVTGHYHDVNALGDGLGQRFREADSQIDSAATLEHMYGIIAQTLMSLNDSHTAFIPPRNPSLIRNGWNMKMIGDSCFVTDVEPGSDADSKGLKPGAFIRGVSHKIPTRQVLHEFDYLTRVLSPERPTMLTVEGPDGSLKDLVVSPVVVRRFRPIDFAGQTGDIEFANYLRAHDRQDSKDCQRLKIFRNELAIWKIPRFAMSSRELESAMENVAGSGSLILDLRCNPGGYATNLARLAGYFFGHDVTLCYLESRGIKDSIVAVHEKHFYDGRVFVLIDSKSTSSAEVFARTMQLRHRGLVLGDASGGMVAKAEYFPRKMGAQQVVAYGSYITTATIMMPDGSHLEGSGVIPDVRIIPTSSDLAAGRDPVLAHAAQLAGFCIDARQAAELFPIE
ncbi:MAG TPA: S41 family peptidase [Bacteroidota bacterium]